MGDITEEPVLRGNDLLRPFHHDIEITAQVGNFIAAPAETAADPGGIVAAGDLLGNLLQSSYRCRQGSGEEIADKGYDQQHDGSSDDFALTEKRWQKSG